MAKPKRPFAGATAALDPVALQLLATIGAWSMRDMQEPSATNIETLSRLSVIFQKAASTRPEFRATLAWLIERTVAYD